MSKRKFTTDQIIELSRNKNVAKCSDKSITYSKNFKVLAVKKYYEEGLSPDMIFAGAGFDISLIGINVPCSSLQRWRRTYNIKGVSRLRTETRGNTGRSRASGLSDAEKVKRMEVEIAYLKAENDFLIKLRAAKKRQN